MVVVRVIAEFLLATTIVGEERVMCDVCRMFPVNDRL